VGAVALNRFCLFPMSARSFGLQAFNQKAEEDSNTRRTMRKRARLGRCFASASDVPIFGISTTIEAWLPMTACRFFIHRLMRETSAFWGSVDHAVFDALFRGNFCGQQKRLLMSASHLSGGLPVSGQRGPLPFH